MEKEGKKPENWTEVYQKIADRQMERADRLVSEVLSDADKKDKRKSVLILVLIFGLIISNAYWLYQWSSYDYISQDGEGYNYYNSDVEGDILNGAADQAEEE